MRSLKLCVVGCLFLSCCLGGQVSSSRLEGTVQDESGAVIPGAKIEAVNVKTQIHASTTADAAGHFIFPSLAPSEYTVTVEAAGFRKAVHNNVILGVAETVTETVKLELGAVTESVSVEAREVTVQLADAQVSRAITTKDIELLPQLGRGPKMSGC